MPKLTAERARELLDYDQDTGVLAWKKKPPGWRKKSLVAGCPCSKGYLRTVVDQQACYNHRLAWLIVTGVWPENEIDHRNGVRDDNRLSNLRDVTNTTNKENKRVPRSSSVSGFLGVSWIAKDNKFRAVIVVSGKYYHLGSFLDPAEAHQAYLEAKRRLHPGNTL